MTNKKIPKYRPSLGNTGYGNPCAQIFYREELRDFIRKCILKIENNGAGMYNEYDVHINCVGFRRAYDEMKQVIEELNREFSGKYQLTLKMNNFSAYIIIKVVQ